MIKLGEREHMRDDQEQIKTKENIMKMLRASHHIKMEALLFIEQDLLKKTDREEKILMITHQIEEDLMLLTEVFLTLIV